MTLIYSFSIMSSNPFGVKLNTCEKNYNYKYDACLLV